jgi:hypothetical protein
MTSATHRQKSTTENLLLDTRSHISCAIVDIKASPTNSQLTMIVVLAREVSELMAFKGEQIQEHEPEFRLNIYISEYAPGAARLYDCSDRGGARHKVPQLDMPVTGCVAEHTWQGRFIHLLPARGCQEIMALVSCHLPRESSVLLIEYVVSGWADVLHNLVTTSSELGLCVSMFSNSYAF